MLVKQTLQEFKTYLEEAREKHARRAEAEAEEAAGVPESVLTGVTRMALSADANSAQAAVVAEDVDQDDSDSDDADDEDECDDELDYTAQEEVIVEAVVRLMGRALGCIKQTLFIATAVCDVASAGTAEDDDVNNPTTQYAQQWVAQLAHLTQLLNKDVLDLGAELYPPFESDCSKIQGYFENLRAHCTDYLRLVDVESLRALQTAENAAKIAELLSEVDACVLSI